MRKKNEALRHKVTHTKSSSILASAKIAPLALAVSGICANGAFAQGEDPGRSLEEVIVVAQKREENLQDVPVTVNNVSGELLREQNIESLKDVKSLIPGIAIRENNDPRNVGLFIRGIGSLQNFIGVEPTSAVVVDGEVMARNSALFGDINDVDEVDVLKGPQGTLFGKNTVAGALVVRTRRPSLEENSGNLKITVAESGNNAAGEHNVAATYNRVLDDNSAVRFNLFRSVNDGWVENVLDGPNGGAVENEGARMQFLHALSDDTELLFRAEVGKRNLGPGLRVYLQRDDFDFSSFGQDEAAVIQYLVDNGYDPDEVKKTRLHRLSRTPAGPDNDKTSALNNRNYGEIDNYAASFELTHNFDSGHELIYMSHVRLNDLFSNPNTPSVAVDAFPENYSGNVTSRTFQNELRIASPLGEKFDYVAGIYTLISEIERDQKVLLCQQAGLMGYFWDVVGGEQPSGVDPNTYELTDCAGEEFGSHPITGELTGFIGPNGLGEKIYNRELRDNVLETVNAAIFGQFNYHITDQVTATVGARFLQEEQDFSLWVREDGVPNTDVRETLFRIRNTNGAFITNDDLSNGATGTGQARNLPNPDYGRITDNPASDLDARNPDNPFVKASADSSDNHLIYKAALQYRPIDDVMFYASYTTGYKGVAWFTDSDVRQADLDSRYPLDPEEATNIEVGVRSEWFDGTLRVNVTYFDAEYENYQERTRIIDTETYPLVNGGLENYATWYNQFVTDNGTQPTPADILALNQDADPSNDPPSGQPIELFDIVDAGTLASNGIDMEVQWNATEWLTLSAAWNHVEAEFEDTDVIIPCFGDPDIPTSNCTTADNYGRFFDYAFWTNGSFYELDGAQLAHAPEDTLVADARVDFSLGSWNSYVRWNYRYQSEEFTNPGGPENNNDSTTVDAFGIHNLFWGISSPDDTYKFTFFIKNLFDEHYYLRPTNYGDGQAENLVGVYPPIQVPELAGSGFGAYVGYGPNGGGGAFLRTPTSNAIVPRDFNRYMGASFEMRF